MVGGHYCCVVGCTNGQQKCKGQNIHFFRFPKSGSQRELWISKVNRIEKNGKPWQPTESSRICSVHFLNNERSIEPLHPSYVPSIFPTKHKREATQAMLERHQRQVKRLSKGKSSKNCEKKEHNDAPEENNQDDNQIENEGQDVPVVIDYEVQDVPVEEPKFKSIAIQTDISGMAPIPMRSVNVSTSTEHRVETTGTMTDIALVPQQYLEKSKTFDFFGVAEMPFQALTGINYNILAFIIRLMALNNIPTKRRGIDIKTCIVMVFLKLKLNLSYKSLGGIFNISDRQASNIFSKTLASIHECVQPLIFWFNRKSIKRRMPPCFKNNFPWTRVIIDASEVSSEHL